jgi:flagellar hook-associated protein 2
MGTVGLSFGSPTSGAGFDVSTTVAEIVGNLQDVETPWKSQLTSLQAQDTTISSLGKLFSNLSNDISGLTDFQGVLAQKEGSSSNQDVLQLTAATSSALAGTHTVTVSNLAQTSSGYLAPLANANDILTGSITVGSGVGTGKTVTLNSTDNTLSGLASAINASGAGVTASVLTDANGSRLSLVSSISGLAGGITVSANTLSAAVSNTLTYTGTAGTSTANSTGTLSAVASPSETLSGTMSIQVGSGTAIPVDMSVVSTVEGGATLSDLAEYINSNFTTQGVEASVVTNSDGTSSLELNSQTAGSAGTLTVNSSIVDPATALSYTSAVSGQNANLTVDGISLSSASNTVANLIPGVTFQLLGPCATNSDGSLQSVQVVIANSNAGVESSVSAMVSDYNAAISALNAQDANNASGQPEPLFGSPTLSLLQQQLLGSLNAQSPNGYLDSIPAKDGTTLTGSITIAVGSATAQTITLDSSDNTIAGLAQAINNANLGVNAGVSTIQGQSSLTLASQTEGAAGALTVTSAIVAASPTPLTFNDAETYTSSTDDTGTVGNVASASDILSGTIAIQAGSGNAQTFTIGSSDNTLSGLATTINQANLGVAATVIANSDGTSSLQLVSGTAGSSGVLRVSSKLLDTTSLTNTTLNYNTSSDLGSLTSLGISVNNDGSLTLDTTALDSLLNTDYSGVVSFFQDANSWGQNFSTTLENAGTSQGTGVLAMASSANSTVESTLNAQISREQSLISAQQTSLTNELNSANEIMQQLPSQLQGVNELYSAITGYNQSTNG